MKFIDKTNLKGVLFDLGGTLVYILNDPDFRTRAIYDQFLSIVKPGDPVKPSEEHCEFMMNFWLAMKQDHFSRGEDFPLCEFITSALKVYGFTDDSIQRIAPQFEEVIFNYEYNNTALIDGAIELLDYLAKNGYQIGLVSNTSYGEHKIRKILEKVNIDNFFELVITSSDERCSKPNPAIFQKALALMGLYPHEAVYIGDRPEFDVQGAENAGMQWILISPETDLRQILKTFQSP